MSKPAADRLLPIVTYIRGLISQGSRQPHPRQEAEASVTWMQFRFNWLLLALALAVFDLCLLLTDFRIRPLGYFIVLAIACVFGVCGHRNALSFSGKPRALSTLMAFAQTVLMVSVLTSLSYIATAADLPLQDSRLLAADRAIGFDFRAVLAFVNDQVWLIRILAFRYNAIPGQMWLIVLALPLLGYYQRSAEYISAFIVALAVT